MPAPHAEKIAFSRDGDEIRGYLARPGRGEQPGARHAGLVLVPDVRGLYDHFRDVARRFADEGFVTLALDLYSREGTPELADMDAIFAWMQALPDRRVLADIGAAVDHLAARDDVAGDRIGVTGFCMGGQYALMASCSDLGLAAAVSWYGMLRYARTSDVKPQSPLEMASALGCPYLGLFGADDELVPATDVEELRSVLEHEKKTYEIEVYDDAGHAFFNDSRPEMYRAVAAGRAWPRALAFLNHHLSGR